jgi:CRP/FNR family transcriptional regulator
MRILMDTSLFRGLAPSDLAELAPALRERSFGRGQSLWVEGDPVDALYVVAEGQLKSYRVSRDGREIILGLHSRGAVTGEVGLFHPAGTRLVSVAAMTPSRCLTLGKTPLLRFLARHPPTMERMLELLSQDTVQAAYAFSGVAFEDIRGRVARMLLTLVSEFGEPVPDGARITLHLSQGTLAALVAASRENVNRALSTLTASGAVSHRGGRFHIHDLAALERMAAAEEAAVQAVTRSTAAAAGREHARSHGTHDFSP